MVVLCEGSFNDNIALRGSAQSAFLDKAVEALKTIAKQFAVTTGADGSLLWDGEQLMNIAPRRVSVVDTNGAGDMYSGAFLYGITNGMGFEEAGSLASMASATVVTQYGPRLDPKAHKQLLSLP